ncbi:hypothetical protein KKG31_02365 [Patescibacteria group bacterium]|nr:hypothetical protein [Patescibacteria group bacterium]MBU1758014.1 hypothetical protein [Patescibacteria group bacterium]
MKTMFIKTNLKKALSVVMIVQLLFSTVFGVSYMTLGRTATDVTVVNGSTILQKAYCDNGDYYINVDPGSETTVQRLNMLLRYESGDTTIATGNFTYNSFL